MTTLEECYVPLQQTHARGAAAEVQFALRRVARARGDQRAPAQQLTAILVEYRNYWGNKREIAYCLEELAGLAATTQYPLRAAHLFGTAEALRASFGMPLPPVYRANYECDMLLICATLDEATVDGAWAAGRALTLEQAIAEALRE